MGDVCGVAQALGHSGSAFQRIFVESTRIEHDICVFLHPVEHSKTVRNIQEAPILFPRDASQEVRSQIERLSAHFSNPSGNDDHWPARDRMARRQLTCRRITGKKASAGQNAHHQSTRLHPGPSANSRSSIRMCLCSRATPSSIPDGVWELFRLTPATMTSHLRMPNATSQHTSPSL